MEIIGPKKEWESTTARKKLLLAVLSMTLGSVSRACRHARINRDTYYEWRKSDPAFASAAREAAGASLGYHGFQVKKELQDGFLDCQKEDDAFWKQYLADK